MTDRQMRHMLSHAIATAQPAPERYYHICWWEQAVRCQHVRHTQKPHEVFFSAPGDLLLSELSAVQWRMLTTRIDAFCRRQGLNLDLHSGQSEDANESQTQRPRVTESDAARLDTVLADARSAESALYPRAHLDGLERLLQEAQVVASADVPEDVVTMNSQVRLRNEADRREMDLFLVFPADARGSDLGSPKLSIFTDTGLSLLGRRVGDRIDGHVRILDLPYQPEAAGDFDL